jgi:hypothetical protein
MAERRIDDSQTAAFGRRRQIAGALSSRVPVTSAPPPVAPLDPSPKCPRLGENRRIRVDGSERRRDARTRAGGHASAG